MENKTRKKKKNIKLIVITVVAVAIVLAIVIGLYTVIDKANKDRKVRQTREREIETNFKKFSEAAYAFGDEAVEYEEWIKDDINENTVYQYDSWLLSLNNMAKALKDMDSVSNIYETNCIAYHYSGDVQEKCNAFIDAYERAVNTFVAYVEDFNTKIAELSEKTKNEDLKEYELKYKKIDLNKNKTYEIIEFEEVEEETEEE